MNRQEFRQLRLKQLVKDGFEDGEIVYDPVKGAGAIPNHQDIMYFGIVVLMRPADYLRCAKRMTLSEHSARTVQRLKELDSIAPPYLSGYFDNGILVIDGHEGRHRAMMVGQTQNDLMPVYIKTGRARDISEELFKSLTKMKVLSENGSLVNNPIEAAIHQEHGIIT